MSRTGCRLGFFLVFLLLKGLNMLFFTGASMVPNSFRIPQFVTEGAFHLIRRLLRLESFDRGHNNSLQQVVVQERVCGR